MGQIGVDTLLVNIYAVLKSASVKCKVLEESFPATFYESNPDKLFESYQSFISKRVTGEGDIKDEGKIKLTTISEKFEKKQYNPERNGFFKLYHDLKLVCTILIHYYSQGTRNYQMVDKFYRFATELLLRECYRYGISLIDQHLGPFADDSTDLGKLIANDFIKISTSYKVPLIETYHIKTRDIDLFSSAIAKSQLDKRPRELPNSHFEVNKILPQTNLLEEAPRLGFIAANTSNIPDPTFPPTEMMTKFLHPNWYSLPTTMWLDYGDFKSWTPFCTENNTVSNSVQRGRLWLERIGYTKLYQKNENNVIVDLEHSGNEKEHKDHQENEQKLENNEERNEASDKHIKGIHEIEQADDVKDNNKVSIKLENLLNWQPENEILKEDLEAIKGGDILKYVSSKLSKLQKLRKERILNRVMKPTKEEIKLYHKSKILLREVLMVKQCTNSLPKPSNSMPILQANYNGNIPVVRSQPFRRRKYKR